MISAKLNCLYAKPGVAGCVFAVDSSTSRLLVASTAGCAFVILRDGVGVSSPLGTVSTVDFEGCRGFFFGCVAFACVAAAGTALRAEFLNCVARAGSSLAFGGSGGGKVCFAAAEFAGACFPAFESPSLRFCSLGLPSCAVHVL